MAHAQLHEVKMVPGITAEDYTARFDMLTGRTGFNNAVLKDIYIWGLPNSILHSDHHGVTAGWFGIHRTCTCDHCTC